MPPNPKYRKLENETVGVIDSSVSDEEDSVIEEMGNALEKAAMKDMSMSALHLKLQFLQARHVTTNSWAEARDGPYVQGQDKGDRTRGWLSGLWRNFPLKYPLAGVSPFSSCQPFRFSKYSH